MRWEPQDYSKTACLKVGRMMNESQGLADVICNRVVGEWEREERNCSRISGSLIVFAQIKLFWGGQLPGNNAVVFAVYNFITLQLFK